MHSSLATDFVSLKTALSRKIWDVALDLAKEDEFVRILINSGRLPLPYRYINSSWTTSDYDINRNCNTQWGHAIKDAFYKVDFINRYPFKRF